MSSTRLRAIHRTLGIPSDYGARRGLGPQREAVSLVSIGRTPDDGKILRLTPRTAAAWQRMREAAACDGLVLLPLSGFRSVRRQTQIIRSKLAAGQTIADVLRLVAAPGYSEHHTGRAIDIGSPENIELDERFARTAAFRWLRRRAGAFGFRLSYPRRNPHGIAYEPWHWCWGG
ncbi:MAG: D-alanyl-D-alanine carboxypeptidase family protein [Opitutus sp.]|nr:D-alanyl-D-alanine carboxypeptidase family protein [Opitutus sp.]